MRLASSAGATSVFSPEHVRRLAVPTVLLAAVGIAGLVAPGTWPFEMTFGVVQALLALSVGMLFGRAGLLMLCPFAFAAISVWVVLWINVNIDTRMPFPILVLLGALSAVPAGFLVGGLALRLRDVNLAVVTLAFAAAITAVFSRHSFPGTLDVVRRAGARPSTFKSDSGYYLLGFLILVATGLALEWLGRRPFGQAWRAVRSSERATAAAGLSVPRVKLSAFVTSAFIAGIAGAIYAGQLEGSVDIRSFSPLLSLAVVAAAIMFGAQSLSGAIVAGFLGAIIPVICRRNGWAVEYPQILFGIGAVHALSQGGGGISSTFPWRRPVRSVQEAPAPPPAAEPAGEGGAPVLDIHDLTVRYGALTALDHVSLSVPAGAVVGVIGPNGAGKSTLIDAVTGYVANYSGSVTLEGTSVDHYSATKRARNGLRRTFQQGRAISELNVGDYINLYAHGHIDAATMNEVIGFFGLPPADQPIVFVDVGTRRVLEVAATVASRPVVAFLDEPAAGLGSDEAVTLARHIKEIPSRFGCSVVLIEHNIELVAEVCSHITVLDFGLVMRGRRSPTGPGRPARGRRLPRPGDRGRRRRARRGRRVVTERGLALDRDVDVAAGLVVEQLEVHRMGSTVVRDIHLVAPPGEVTVLLGTNGAGKTTLLEAISGIIPSAKGTIAVNGHEITSCRGPGGSKLGLAHVEQGRAIFPELTAEENLLVAGRKSQIEPSFELFPELGQPAQGPGGSAVGRRAADARDRQGPRERADDPDARRDVARTGAAHHQAADAAGEGPGRPGRRACCSSSSSPTSPSPTAIART